MYFCSYSLKTSCMYKKYDHFWLNNHYSFFPCEKQHPLMNSVLDKKEQTIIAISLKNYPLSQLGRVSYPHTLNAPNIAVVFENQNYD